MKKFYVECRIYEHGIGETDKAYVLNSDSVEAYDEIDAEQIFLDWLLEKVTRNVYLVDTCAVELA